MAHNRTDGQCIHLYVGVFFCILLGFGDVDVDVFFVLVHLDLFVNQDAGGL